MTLIEVLVALVILGILLSAFAGSLVSFGRQSAVNEFRMAATGVLNQAQEDFQSLPLDEVGVYASQVFALTEEPVGVAVFGDDEEGEAAEALSRVLVVPDPEPLDFDAIFEGNPVIVRPDDCEVDEDDPLVSCEFTRVPLAREQVVNGGREFTLYRVFTWVDRTGDGAADTMRLTAIATWELLGRTYTQRSDGERLATVAEAGSLQDIRVFPTIGPRRIPLVGEFEPPLPEGEEYLPPQIRPDLGATTRDLRVLAHFTDRVLGATVEFYSVEFRWSEEDAAIVADNVHQQLDLLPVGTGTVDGWTDFIVDIEAGAYTFTDGFRAFRVSTWVDGQEVYASRAVRFEGDQPEVPDPLMNPELPEDGGPVGAGPGAPGNGAGGSTGGCDADDPDCEEEVHTLEDLVVHAFTADRYVAELLGNGQLKDPLTIIATVRSRPHSPADGGAVLRLRYLDGDSERIDRMNAVDAPPTLRNDGDFEWYEQSFQWVLPAGSDRFADGDVVSFTLEVEYSGTSIVQLLEPEVTFQKTGNGGGPPPGGPGQPGNGGGPPPGVPARPGNGGG